MAPPSSFCCAVIEVPMRLVPDHQLRQRTSREKMSLSSFSSALGLGASSSPLDSSGHKRKPSLTRGEVFVLSSSGDASSSSKSNREAPLPTLLGEPDTASSSGFLSLAVSRSSLSSGQASAPHFSITVSRASEALRELTGNNNKQDNNEKQQQQKQEPENDKILRMKVSTSADEQDGEAVPQQMVVLENVEYVSSSVLPHATSCTDLSTMDEPITKEQAGKIFNRRIVPSEIPVKPENPSEVSTLYGGKHEDEAGVEVEIDVEQGCQVATATESAAMVQVSFPWYHRERKKLELFFLTVMGISGTVLVVLLVVVFR